MVWKVGGGSFFFFRRLEGRSDHDVYSALGCPSPSQKGGSFFSIYTHVDVLGSKIIDHNDPS